MRLSTIAFGALALLNCPLPQTDRTPPHTLPTGVLKQLAGEAKEYCEDQFAEGFRKGCEKKFAAHLRWRELSITPSGKSAILVENDNLGFCGSGGCALYLFVQQKSMKFTQVLGSEGGLGTLERVTVLKKITNGHYDIRVTWSDAKTHSVYQWDGSQYSTDDRDIWGTRSNKSGYATIRPSGISCARRDFLERDFKSLYRKRANMPCSCACRAPSRFRYNPKTYRALHVEVKTFRWATFFETGLLVSSFTPVAIPTDHRSQHAKHALRDPRT